MNQQIVSDTKLTAVPMPVGACTDLVVGIVGSVRA